MVDILPEDTPLWQSMEAAALEVLSSYGYEEIRLPIIESTDLFARSIGEVTDIVEKEMYTFPDRNDDSMTLRPEGTAGCVRAVVQHNLAVTPRRLWYMGPMFRYERPQKGRQRQFHQLGVEAFGVASPDRDAELIALCRQLWCRLGVDDALQLEINTIGSAEDRTRYREALVAYLTQHYDQLDADSQRRLETNPLRILDSKNLKRSRCWMMRRCSRIILTLTPRLNLTSCWPTWMRWASTTWLTTGSFAASTITTKRYLSGPQSTWVHRAQYVAVVGTTRW